MSGHSHHIQKPGWVGEFQKFLVRGNVVDLAVGIIIGAAFTAIVSSLVKDILTPFIGLLTGGIDFSNIFITLKGPHAATLADAQKVGAVTVNVGVFLNAVIQFLIVSFVVFWLVKLVSMARAKPQPAPATPPEPSKSEVLLSEIRDLLATRTGETLPPRV
ncbi:large-conductance mechanosensitive channel protein MscL [Tanticharoenia sakaeratensis]|jgi:large conductance mechanosensitive channel|uniref:Large-conductance mechanosensitive channel n=1 Tax=Tanticharoenia sakaeratensis NBRC 103193 TaxID=1231623 RepID=A0A0D6MJF6_9PROT|nr:large-conductance mechanosensitive channel protein MscL [Tanticharoenia sakaeratensis]GAN53408.1 large-conductance mechanosensitive channel [Tanticharoenia sakaeratensis NBRC 103193]GBQ20739.1 large-conductance mechanosensitive channel [Tanticharoenia sakaeratensis NBRC 103193]